MQCDRCGRGLPVRFQSERRDETCLYSSDIDAEISRSIDGWGEEVSFALPCRPRVSRHVSFSASSELIGNSMLLCSWKNRIELPWSSYWSLKRSCLCSTYWLSLTLVACFRTSQYVIEAYRNKSTIYDCIPGGALVGFAMKMLHSPLGALIATIQGGAMG